MCDNTVLEPSAKVRHFSHQLPWVITSCPTPPQPTHRPVIIGAISDLTSFPDRVQSQVPEV